MIALTLPPMTAAVSPASVVASVPVIPTGTVPVSAAVSPASVAASVPLIDVGAVPKNQSVQIEASAVLLSPNAIVS
jgi:hypothetical protein